VPRRREDPAPPDGADAPDERVDLGAEIDASFPVAVPPSPGKTASGALASEPTEQELERPPVSGESAGRPPEETSGDPGEVSAANDEALGRSRSPVAGMIVGGLVGAAIGALAGLVLLALTQGGGSLAERVAQPAAVAEQLADPLALWQGVSDWLIRMSALLVGGGFLLLGVGWGGRIRSRRRP
jgi:hypothetical protein